MFLRFFRIVLCFVILTTSFAFAQTRVYLNSKELTDSLIIDNEVFVLAKSFADTLNAQFIYNPDIGIVAIDFNEHILIASSDYIEIDNKRINGKLKYLNDKLYLPLKSLAEAYQGSSYSNAELSYMLLPRARLTNSQLNSYADYDRVILEFRNLSSYQEIYNPELNTLELIFDNAYEQPFAVEYGSRLVMELSSSLGYLKLKLILAEKNTYEIFKQANPNGQTIIIDSFATDSPKNTYKKVELILSQEQLGESQYFLSQLSQLLAENDIELEAVAISEQDKFEEIDYLSDVFLAINISEISRSEINIYYQIANSTNYLIRNNATTALTRIVDPSRRALLEKLANNYLFGQELAQRISNTMFNNIGYQTKAIPEDLSLIADYAGRGIVLEMSKDNLNNDLLINTLAQAIIEHLENYD